MTRYIFSTTGLAGRTALTGWAGRIMIQPVILRELTALVHRPEFGRDRWRVGLIGILLLGVGVLMVQVGGGTGIGGTIFGCLAWILWTCCALFGASVTADTLSRERREGTLGLLFLTPLSAWEIVTGKLAGGAAHAFYRLLTLSPMLTGTLLLGGITGVQIIAVVAVCLNTLFLALAFGVFVSSTQTDDRAAFNLTFIGFLGASLFPYGVDAVLPAAPFFTWSGESIFLLLSPAHPIRLLASQIWLGRLIVPSVLVSVAIHQVIAWTLLAATAARCRQVALEYPTNRLAVLAQRIRHWWLFGSRTKRRRHRERLLMIDPIAWLALRHHRKQLYVWVFYLLLTAFAVGLIFSDSSASAAIVTCFIYGFLAILKAWLISETCTRLVDDRRSGAMELILTTETSAQGWICGQSIALKRLFLHPLLTCAVLLAGAVVWNLPYSREIFEPGNLFILFVIVSVTVLDLPAIYWMCLWEGLSAPTVNRATARVSSRAIVPAAFVSLLSYLAWLLLHFNWGTEVEPPGVIFCGGFWLILNAAIDIALYRFARPRVQKRFQEIIADGTAASAPAAESDRHAGRGFRRFLAWHGSASRRHPFVTAGIVILGGAATFICVRNALWDRRVEVAREQLWKVGVPSQLPPAVGLNQANSETTAIAVQTLLQDARKLSNRGLSFHKSTDPYARTNRTAILTSIQPFDALADQILALPADAKIPWGSILTDPWGFSVSTAPLERAALALAIRLQDAVEAGVSAPKALSRLTALDRLSQKLATAPTPGQFRSSQAVAGQTVNAVVHWLNADTPARPDLTTISNLLARMDSWEAADRQLLILPAMVEHFRQNPATLRFGSAGAFSRAVELLTPGSRVSAVAALQQTRQALEAKNLPEARRLSLIDTLLDAPSSASIAYFDLTSICKDTFNTYLAHANLLGRVRSLRAALMVEAFRKSERRLPRDLKEITSQNSSSWPSDPISGEPLRFVPTSLGYQIVRPHSKIANLGNKDDTVLEIRTDIH